MEFFDFKSIPDRMNLEKISFTPPKTRGAIVYTHRMSIIPDRFPFLLHPCAAGNLQAGRVQTFIEQPTPQPTTKFSK
jgi:hypothetical protein